MYTIDQLCCLNGNCCTTEFLECVRHYGQHMMQGTSIPHYHLFPPLSMDRKPSVGCFLMCRIQSSVQQVTCRREHEHSSSLLSLMWLALRIWATALFSCTYLFTFLFPLTSDGLQGMNWQSWREYLQAWISGNRE